MYHERVFCECEVTWEDEAVSCDVCAKWQHRLCHTGIAQEIYNAANRDKKLLTTIYRC